MRIEEDVQASKLPAGDFTKKDNPIKFKTVQDRTYRFVADD